MPNKQVKQIQNEYDEAQNANLPDNEDDDFN